eukprot:3835058-Karenia_brevis.AAC.1
MAKQFAAHEERMSRQDKDIDHMQKEVAESRNQMRDFQSTFATDAVTDPTVDPSYDRSPDYRLLQLNANREISPVEFQHVIEEWLADDFNSDQWE